ncbi:MAG TPA: hypothetical protein VM075_11065 [Anaerolineae bacterium]|nr:hypothetical protein [Anaerolineae bacterium]
MRKTATTIIIVATMLAGCASPAPGPTASPAVHDVAVEATVTAPPTSTPAPSAAPTIRPSGDGCVRATTEVAEGQNPTRFVTSGPASGCYDSVGQFLDDIGLTWGEFVPGMVVAFWTQWPVDPQGVVVYPTATPAPIPTATATRPMPIGPLEIAANPTKGFHWPYFLYAPSSIQGRQILVVPNNTGRRDDDFSVHREWAESTIRSNAEYADSLGVPLIVPVFPRFDDETDGTIASQYLGRGTLEVQWQQRYPQLARQDLQLIAMVDDAREQLAASGIAVNDKILIWGYSASGTFVTRFVALHPERVQAAAFGGHGWTTAPMAEWNGLSLPFPYGTADLEQLVGRPFNLDAYRAVPMYSYMGADDANGWALPWYIGSGYNQAGFYESFVTMFGSSSSSLLASAEEICDSIGCSGSFVLYPETGHQITTQMNDDVLEFLRAHKD